jgi:hypothetical protein
MTAEGIVLILGAIGALLTAGSAAFVMVWKQLKSVHVLVNQNRTDMLQYQNDLIEVLQANKIIIPRDRSTDVPGGGDQ